jgi:hypothetical protein
MLEGLCGLNKTPKNSLQNMLRNTIHICDNAAHIRIPPKA